MIPQPYEGIRFPNRSNKFVFFRNQREDDLRENHPFFDTPLFAVPRESRFRKCCQMLVYARYDARLKDPLTGKERKVQYKSLQ